MVKKEMKLVQEENSETAKIMRKIRKSVVASILTARTCPRAGKWVHHTTENPKEA